MGKLNVGNIVYYFVGCIGGTRAIFIYAVKIAIPPYILYIGLFYILVSIRVFYMFFLGNIDKSPDWYNNFRPIHGLIYLAFSYYCIHGYVDDAWKILLVDTVFGVTTFIGHNIQDYYILDDVKPDILNQ